jgi:hypothetical protein
MMSAMASKNMRWTPHVREVAHLLRSRLRATGGVSHRRGGAYGRRVRPGVSGGGSSDLEGSSRGVRSASRRALVEEVSRHRGVADLGFQGFGEASA